MRRLLAIPLALLALVSVRLGWRPLVHGAPERVECELVELMRGDPPASEHLAVGGGVLVSDGGGAEHVVDGYAYLPVVTPRAAGRIEEEGALDVDRAFGLFPLRRFAVARVALDDLAEVVAASGAGRGDAVLGPIALEGVVEDADRWPEAARARLAAFDLQPERILAIAHGEHPRGRAFGAVAFACAAALGGLARRLWRRRAPEPVAPAPASDAAGRGPTPRPRATAPVRSRGKLVAGAAAVGVVALATVAKLGDGAARTADDLPVVRGVDDAAAARGSADAVAVSDTVLHGMDLGKKAHDWHKYLTTVHGADLTLQAILAETESLSTYGGPGGPMELSGYRAVREMRDVRDGEPGPARRVVDTDLPDAALGEHERARLHPPAADRPAALELDARVRSGSDSIQLRCRAEVELVEGDWSDLGAGGAVELRYTEAGLDALAAETARALERSLSRAMARRMAGVARREIDVVSRPAQCRIRADSTSLTIEALGPSVSEVRIAGWR